MKVPVIVISGFLGSGKTTLLLRLLQEAKAEGLRPGIIMNELGQLDVDGHILREQSDLPVEKLLDGCVCCSKRSELAGSIRTVLRNKPDLLVIELTGVANPEEIADALTDPALIELVRLKQIVTVVDAEHVLDYNSFFESDAQLIRTLRRQIETADILVLNKTDLINDAKRKKIGQLLPKYNDAAVLIPTAHSIIDLGLLLSDVVKQAKQAVAVSSAFPMVKPAAAAAHAAPNQPVEQTRLEKGQAPSFSRVQTISLALARTASYSRKDIEKFLHKFKNRLLRAKGYIRLNPEGPALLLQFAGNRVTWSESAHEGQPYIVFIGINLNDRELEQQWRRLEQ
ncbi:GTP-binding protein [Paenibacillus alkaliterrae]|uniref:CobW family GTP-binding protein n=1 Tax=Paenibacillus alkaliterrae TaxID=320909 RepID=UPI001F4806AA|nr:GTP-binding protein [Paenibacillus alkaliterrae]MCF2940069.1 GTP-binding protein [Paenibacillus alkaliterrae]